MKLPRLLVTCLILLVVFSLASCGNDDGKDGGFKVVKTEPTQTTAPSSEPNLEQPCSLLNAATAADLLGVTEGDIDAPDVNGENTDTVRCRYSTSNEDGSLFTSINVYVFKTKKAFDQANASNNGKPVKTELGGGFSYARANTKESTRFVGAYQGDIRVGVSARVSVTDPNKELKVEEIDLPTLDELANQVGTIISKL